MMKTTPFKTTHLTAPKPDNDAAAMTRRWSATKRLAFEIMEPAALALVATDGPVSVTVYNADGSVKRFGHNRGVWPGKIAKTGSWRDDTSNHYDKSPFFFVGTQFRLWFKSHQARDAGAHLALGLIERRSDEHGGLDALLKGFRDLGSELDLAFFEMEMRMLCESGGLWVRDDAGLSDYLDQIVTHGERLAAEGKARLNAALFERLLGRGA